MTAIAYRPLYEQPPTCLQWLEHSHCVLTHGHDGPCLPLPATYPPTPCVITEVGDEEVTA